MSYCLMVYAARFDKLGPVFGSGDDKIRRMISGRFKRELQSKADYFATEISGGAPSPFDAVRALIMGTVPEKGHGFMYAYGYETIIEHFGRFLDNNAFSSIRWSYMEEVEKAFNRAGLAETLPFSDLYCGKALCKFPHPDDFPCYGYWSPETVVAGQKKFAELELPADMEGYLKDALLAVRGWVNSAASKGEGILGFYY